MIHVNKLGTGNKSGSDANNKMPIQTAFNALPDNSAVTIYADDYSGIEYMYRGTGRVTFRAKDGERVILYQKFSGPLVHKENCLNISRESKGVKFINIEISGKQTNYDKRTNPGLTVAGGVSLDGSGNELRNIIIHDVAGVGVSSYSDSGTARIYRAIVYYSGYVDETGKSKGHNAYFQQFGSGVKEFVDMFLFGGMRNGGHTYGTRGMKNMKWIRPVVYHNGSINPAGHRKGKGELSAIIIGVGEGLDISCKNDGTHTTWQFKLIVTT